jgi:DNA-binding NarL/FixJ family response regulator
MIRLFIIEDHHTLVISSLRFMFRPERDGIKVTGYAETLDNAINNADPDSFDLIFLDLHLPGHLPIDNIRALKRHFPGKPVLIYTSETSSSWKNKMMDEGAHAYVTKDATREELKITIQKVAKGEILFIGTSNGKMSNAGVSVSNSKEISLSPIQVEIVTLLAEGLTHKKIADRIGISLSLVEKILKNIRTKFRTANNIELIKYLTENGFF